MLPKLPQQNHFPQSGRSGHGLPGEPHLGVDLASSLLKGPNSTRGGSFRSQRSAAPSWMEEPMALPKESVAMETV